MTMIRSELCNKTSCDLVRSCLCRTDRETAARDVIKLLLSESDCRPRIKRTIKISQLPLRYGIGLYQSPASESFIIHGCQGNHLLHQMGVDMMAQHNYNNQQQHVTKVNKPTAVQLAIVLLKLREQLPSFFDGYHDFNLYSPNVRFEYSVAWQLPMVTVGKQRYKMIVEAFRHITHCMWASPEIKVIKITKVIDSGTIECRWRMCGQLRGTFGRGKERVLYDAFSVFTVNCNGLISQHKLQKVMPHPTAIKATTSWWDYLLTRVTARTTN